MSSKLNILFLSLIMFQSKDSFPIHPLNNFFFQVVSLTVMRFVMAHCKQNVLIQMLRMKHLCTLGVSNIHWSVF